MRLLVKNFQISGRRQLIKQHIAFQISVTYAFTEVVHVQSDTRENSGNVEGKKTFDAFFGQIGQD